MKKVGIIVLIAILIALICILTGVIIIAINGDGQFSWFIGVEKIEENISKSENVSILNIDEIELDLKHASVNIELTESQELKIIQYIDKNVNDKKIFNLIITDNKIRVEQEENRVNFAFFGFGNMNKIAYDIYLPKEYAKKFNISTTSGDIEFNNDIDLEKININTTSGSVKSNFGIVSNDTTISCISGDIEINNAEGEKLNVSTTSGNIRIANAKGEKTIQATSGNIYIENCNDNGGIQASSGNIKISNYVGNGNIKATSGNINIGTYKGSGEIKASSGNVKIQDATILEDTNIKTTSGNITIDINKETNCEIRTKTTSGKVTVPNGSHIVGVAPYKILDLQATSGNIKIN